jgi:predicted PurR-regulated permease PerM
MNRRRTGRLILVLALIILIVALLWLARGALFPFILALVLAYIVLPIVTFFERGVKRIFPRFRGSRAVAIVLTYLAAILVLALFFLLIAPVIGQQFETLWENRQEIARLIEGLVDDALAQYRENVPQDIQTQIAASLRQAGERLSAAAQGVIGRTVGAVTSTVVFIAGLVIVPVWLFYVLYDQSRFMRKMVEVIPAQIRTDTVNVIRISDRILSQYLRGQLLLCVVVGVLATIGLALLGVPFFAVLGLIAGIFEILPFVGPIIGMVPAVLVAAIERPILGLWTLLLFIGIQQVENTVLVPRISGRAVELHPALIVLVLIIGSQVAGLTGAILAVPVAAIIRDVFKYLYLRLSDAALEPAVAMDQISATPLRLDV